MDREEIESSLEEELTEFVANAGGDDEEAKESVESNQTAKRGRPFIPLKWTPVMSLDQDYPLKMTIKELAVDM